MTLADHVTEMAAGKRPLLAYDRTMGFHLVSWAPQGPSYGLARVRPWAPPLRILAFTPGQEMTLDLG